LEKANAKVLDLFLQVLDEGNMTDGAGRKVDFTNAILIATSNAASSDIANHISKGEKYEEVEKQVLPKLREVYRVEFLNRFDKVIMFKPLTAIEVEQIAEIMLNKINKRIEIKGISIKWNERTVKELVDLGYDPVYGARELRRVIQEKIEDELANLIILGKLKSGQVAVFNGLNVEQII
jgi:ATP-dependent Clp protease ATP-binding subunit ClpA